MPICESCWEKARNCAAFRGGSVADHYYVVMREREREKAVCTQDTLEGRRARAGQFWDEATQRDTREGAW